MQESKFYRSVVLKYYEYVSDTKINMLYSQIKPTSNIDREHQLKGSLGVIQSTVKSKRTTITPDSSIGKIPFVESHLKKNKLVGDLGSNKKYVSGKLKLRHIINKSSDEANDIAFWGGVYEGITFAMVGSIGSLIGYKDSVNYTHNATFYRVALQHIAKKYEEGFIIHSSENQPLAPDTVDETKSAIETWIAEFFPDEHKEFDFVAKVIESNRTFVLASPIYIAEA